MSTKKSHIPRAGRNGEGVPLTIRPRENGAGEFISMEIDLRNLPVPERRYTADMAACVVTDDFVRLLFGQTKVDGVQLRSLLDIHFPKASIPRFLRSVENIHDTLSAIKEKFRISPAKLSDIVDEPNQTIGLTANVVYASVSGFEAGMDFFHISSFSAAEAKRGNSLSAEPVVRVTLSTALFVSLVDMLESLKDSLPVEL